MSPHVRSRTAALTIAAVFLAVVIALAVYFRLNQTPPAVDAWWMRQLVAVRTPWLDSVALVFNAVGGEILGTFIVPLGVALVLLIVRRPWASAFFLVASLLSLGIVQLLKTVVGRARPADMIVTSDFGSFPSGHTANAATMVVVLGLLLRRGWVWAVGAVYCVLMLLSRNYLGAHWLSDTIAGLLLGTAIVLIVWLPFRRRLQPSTS
jgi:membrane-associated phospholipid phosphatase